MTDKEDLIKVMEEPHILAVEMTEDEIRYDQEQLLHCLQRIEDLDLEKKASLADYKARMEKLKETYEDLTTRLRSRRAMRSIMCTLELNYSRLTATLRNKETGSIVQQRPMSQEERRMDPTEKLPFEEDAEDAQVNGTSPTEEESTSAEPVEESNEIEAEFEPNVEDVNAHAKEKFGSDPPGAQLAENLEAGEEDSFIADADTGAQLAENLEAGEEDSFVADADTNLSSADVDDDHAEEKFGSDPTETPAAPSATDTPVDTGDPGDDDAQADDDLAMWMGLDA